MAKSKAQRSLPKKLPVDASGTVRLDGWSNLNTGFGVPGKDKRLGSDISVCLLTQEQSESIWRADAIAARMVETLPREMLREGYSTITPDDTADGEAIDARALELGVATHFKKGMEFGKALGGGAVLLGVDDGQTLDQPLNEKDIRAFKFLTTFTPRELFPVKWYADPTGPRYGEISQYRIQPFDTVPDQNVFDLTVVHESRLIRFDGVTTTRGSRLRNNNQPGWDDSIFVRSMQTIQDFQHAHQGLAAILQDFSVPVLKIKGLAKLLATTKAGDTTLLQRANALELCRSIMRVAIVDSEEEYKRETTPVNGLGDLLEQVALKLAAEASMPVSLLMGQAPAGLNATGDSDIRWFYDQIKADQKSSLKPKLQRVNTLIALDKSGPLGGVVPKNWNIKFHPLYQLTESEQADVRLKMAQADAANIASGIVTPEEVAESRFGGDEFSTETQLNTDDREAYAAADSTEPEDPTQPPGAPASQGTTGPMGSPLPGAKAPTAPKAADKAMAGGQISGALEIVQEVVKEQIPRDSALAMLVHFFAMTPEQAEQVMGTAGNGFKPKPPEASPDTVLKAGIAATAAAKPEPKKGE